jgi:uncharacterized membrane protein YeaQ/YmgE (transglycosylase-associated protein family)
MIIISWLIIGLAAGILIGSLGGGTGFGLLGDIIIGISGAILGGFMVLFLIDPPHLVEGLNMDNLFGALSGGILAVMLIGALPEPSKEERS